MYVTLRHEETPNQQVVAFNEVTKHEREEKGKKERWRESYLNSKLLPYEPDIN